MKKTPCILLAIGMLASILSSCNSCGKKKNDYSKLPNNATIKQIQNAIQQDTNNAKNYFLLGKAFADVDSFDLAVDYMLKAIKKNPRDPQLYSGVSNMFLKFNRSYESIDVLKKYLQLVNPKDVNILMQLGLHYLYVKKNNESIATFNEVLKLQNYNADAYYYKALNYDELGDETKAISTLQTAVEQNSNHIASYIKLGNIYESKLNPLCIKYYDNAIRIDSNNVEAIYGKAYYYHEKNEIKESLKQYRKIINIEPQNFDAHFNTGYIYYSHDSLDKAVRSFNIAIQVEPTSSDAYYYRGLTYEKQKNIAQARKDFNQAIVFDKDNEDARNALNRLDAIK